MDPSMVLGGGGGGSASGLCSYSSSTPLPCNEALAPARTAEPALEAGWGWAPLSLSMVAGRVPRGRGRGLGWAKPAPEDDGVDAAAPARAGSSRWVGLEGVAAPPTLSFRLTFFLSRFPPGAV